MYKVCSSCGEDIQGEDIIVKNIEFGYIEFCPECGNILVGETFFEDISDFEEHTEKRIGFAKQILSDLSVDISIGLSNLE